MTWQKEFDKQFEHLKVGGADFTFYDYKKIKSFISSLLISEREKVIKEFVEGLLPENKYHECSLCSYGSVYQECSCFDKACKEIQERINNKLKEI